MYNVSIHRIQTMIGKETEQERTKGNARKRERKQTENDRNQGKQGKT